MSVSAPRYSDRKWFTISQLEQSWRHFTTSSLKAKTINPASLAMCIPLLHDSDLHPQVVPKAHAGCVTALLAAPAGNSFFSGGHDGFIRQWRATNGHPIGCWVGMVTENMALFGDLVEKMPNVLKLAIVYIKSIHCPSFLRNDFSKQAVCEWIRD